MNKTMRSKFLCQFQEVSLYPFGTERCWIKFYLKNNQETRLEASLNVSSKSAETIGQYTVWTWFIEDADDVDGEEEVKKVTVLLKRGITVTVLATHLPTFLMNLINHMSIFITGESNYELIITVNVTCMMVLASIYLGNPNKA